MAGAPSRPHPVTTRLMVAEVISVGPDAVPGHVEPVSHRLAPCRCRGWFAPVIGDAHSLPILQLADRHVPVQAAVPVVSGPLHDDNVVEPNSPAHLQGELGEVTFDLSDQPSGPDDLAHLRALAHHAVGQRDAQDVGEPALRYGSGHGTPSREGGSDG